MQVLLTGANGFIGSHLTRAILKSGHQVIGAVKNVAEFKRKFPAQPVFEIDMVKALNPDDWMSCLKGIDAIVNCAGILQSKDNQVMWNVHHKSPAALFSAAEQAGIRKVIHISAISAVKEIGTQYALSKLAAEDDLRKRDLDWVVLRPSLVIADNAYGGTEALRQQAAFPFIVPVVGTGNQVFQPVTMSDLAAVVIKGLSGKNMNQKTIEVVGPKVLTVREILKQLRPWLGKKPAGFLPVPIFLVSMVAKISDLLDVGPLRTTALKHMIYGNAGGKDAVKKLETLLGNKLQTLDDFLKNNPPVFTGR